MPKLNEILEEIIYKKNLNEADEEAPDETSADDSEDTSEDDDTEDTEEIDDTPVEGAEEANKKAGEDEMEEFNEEDPAEEEIDDNDAEEAIENFEDLDKAIESMIGMTEIQHTSSSTIIDFEDGGQVMFVHPMVSLKTETINDIIKLIIKDVKNSYAESKDEITGKSLKNTRYWKSIETLIETMVKSQMTKSDNMNGLIDEIKEIFKVLEVK